MFRGLPEARTGVILLKIKIFYPKTGLRFALAGHISEKVFFIVTHILSSFECPVT